MREIRLYTRHSAELLLEAETRLPRGWHHEVGIDDAWRLGRQRHASGQNVRLVTPRRGSSIDPGRPSLLKLPETKRLYCWWLEVTVDSCTE